MKRNVRWGGGRKERVSAARLVDVRVERRRNSSLGFTLHLKFKEQNQTNNRASQAGEDGGSQSRTSPLGGGERWALLAWGPWWTGLARKSMWFFHKIEGTLFIFTNNVIDLDIFSLSVLSPVVEH